MLTRTCREWKPRIQPRPVQAQRRPVPGGGGPRGESAGGSGAGAGRLLGPGSREPEGPLGRPWTAGLHTPCVATPRSGAASAHGVLPRPVNSRPHPSPDAPHSAAPQDLWSRHSCDPRASHGIRGGKGSWDRGRGRGRDADRERMTATEGPGPFCRPGWASPRPTGARGNYSPQNALLHGHPLTSVPELHFPACSGPPAGQACVSRMCSVQAEGVDGAGGALGWGCPPDTPCFPRR